MRFVNDSMIIQLNSNVIPFSPWKKLSCPLVL
jgi:hypothetical protein